jgi:hypothetical protein
LTGKRLSLPGKKPSVTESIVRMTVMKRDYCVLPVVELDCWRKMREIEKELNLEKEKEDGSRKKV